MCGPPRVVEYLLNKSFHFESLNFGIDLDLRGLDPFIMKNHEYEINRLARIKLWTLSARCI